MLRANPIQHSERIFILDAIRGFALCGILILNIYYFARPEPAFFNLNVYHEIGTGNVATWYITNFLVEGSFRALFSMLFGAGCILLVSRLQKKDNSLKPADIYYTRLIWLMIFGLINAFVLLWAGDILYSYAVCGLFIFPFRNSSVKVLLLMVLFFISITMFRTELKNHDRLAMKEKGEAAIALQKQHRTLTDEQQANIKKLADFNDEHSVEKIRKESDKEIKVFQGSYGTVFTYLAPINQRIESSIFYEVLFFDVLIFIFLGMALYKTGILTGAFPAWVYALFIAIGYPIGLGMGYVWGHTMRTVNYNILEYLSIRPFYVDLYQVHRVLVALGNLGVIILLWKSGWFSRLLKPLARVGQMAFTNYLMQSVICTLIFNGYGFGYFGEFERYQLWYFVASVWIFQLAFSTIWLKFFLFGPLEWVWRSLTYWKIQPFRRTEQI